jgi:hypothetical protein
MSAPTPARNRPDYGIDAPPVLNNLLLLGAAGLGVATVLKVLDVPHPWHVPLFEIALIMGINFFLNAAGMLWYSKIHKFHAREGFLDLVPW